MAPAGHQFGHAGQRLADGEANQAIEFELVQPAIEDCCHVEHRAGGRAQPLIQGLRQAAKAMIGAPRDLECHPPQGQCQ
jgi:hypothetical protein